MAFEGLGKLLIYIGVIVLMIGGLLLLLARVPWIGKLPGDLIIQRSGIKIYIPITTMILVSIFLNILFTFILRR